MDKNGETVPVENIVLVGRTGNGKSATGNSIARERAFLSEARARGVTMQCESVIVDIPEGKKLRVIDTPGLFDSTASANYISEQIIRCLHLAEGGLHAVLLVLSVKHHPWVKEEVVLSTLEVLFGSEIFDYLIVVFTSGDVLEEDETIQDYLEDCPGFLKRLLETCEQRLVVFNNRTREESIKKNQVKELLNAIDKVRNHTNYQPYTEDMYQKIKEETERKKKEHDELAKKVVTQADFQDLRKELLLINEQNRKEMMKKLMLINDQNLKEQAKMREENIEMVEQREKAELDRHLAEEQQQKTSIDALVNQLNDLNNALAQMDFNRLREIMERGNDCNIL